MSAPSASAPPALAVERLNAWYGTAQVLYDVAFTVERGEVVALMGRNGAGKSTTMKAVIGLLTRRSGTVLLNGRDISALRPFEIARLGLGFTPEDRRIFSDLTVMENLDAGRQPPRAFADGTPAPAWTPEALFRLFPNLAEMCQRLGGRMSGGEQQMLTIARELKKRGLSILLSEQNVGFAEIVSDCAYMLETGQIRWGGTMAELAESAEAQTVATGRHRPRSTLPRVLFYGTLRR